MTFELCSIYIDSAKMKVVSELIKQRPNLQTVILNAEILKYPPSYITDWLFELNVLELKFFYANSPDDMDAAFKNLDIDGDNTISLEELGRVCNDQVSDFWIWKYGANYKVLIFIVLLNKVENAHAIPMKSFCQGYDSHEIKRCIHF